LKKKKRFAIILTVSVLLPLFFAAKAISQAGNNVIPPRPQGPCDIYTAAGFPCVAAHSTTRALSASYNGPLYQVMRQSDGKTLDIGIVKPGRGDAGGYADAAAQDAFCVNTLGWITKIYDQSGKGNDLIQAPPGTFKGPAKGAFNTLPIADMAPVTINGHKVYGVYIMPGMGLRNNNTNDIAINDEAEGIYSVINGKHFSSGCCFDYGNASTNSRAVGTGTMETTYYGTATAWGSGNGAGPWIMTDLEAGLFSGYNAKKNDVPSFDSLRFITAIVDGGGGNKWNLRGGDAQQGRLTTFYSGVRPGTPGSNNYYPMNKKGGILLGNGGDNGNGSAGTFYEGVMTTGFPTEATTDAVQANIVATKYDVQRLNFSRLLTFTPKSVQEATLTFTNTTGATVKAVKFSIASRKGWTALASGSTSTSKIFAGPILPDESVSATFKISSPLIADAGFTAGTAEWTNPTNGKKQVEKIAQRIRNTIPVKINEVRFNTESNSTNQFIELYNASANEVDISRWNIISTQSGWAPVILCTIPAGTKLAAHGFYLLGLATSGLVAPANPGEHTINVRSITGFEVGQSIDIGNELQTIAKIGTAATAMTTLFVPVSTGPWLTIPAGAVNLPVTNAAGFTVGDKMGIDIGGNFEVVNVTAVGKAATQTDLSVGVKAGENIIKVADNANMTIGDVLILSTGFKKEVVTIKSIVSVVSAPARFAKNSPAGEIELTAPLKFDHMPGIDVSDEGTGISFSPATRFVHRSGDAVQALGSGITLENKLSKNHETGASVINKENTTVGYQELQKPNQWYGNPLAAAAGSIALMDANSKVLADALVYGSRQSSSSANGTITSPEIATLEGNQSQGGCIVVSPSGGRGFGPATDQGNKSVGRYPDGNDNDENCSDFLVQQSSTLSLATVAGSNNIKVASVADFVAGQKIFIGSGATSEATVITTVGMGGGTAITANSEAGTTIISVGNIVGFVTEQTITVGNDGNLETAVIASMAARRRFGNATRGSSDSITLTIPLKYAHNANEQVSGSGITIATALAKAHNSGEPVADNIPTPGAPNEYNRERK